MCAQYRRPAGVAFSLQVCRYSIEPPVPNRACNLLPKDMLRAALADEVEEDGPEVALVGLSESFSGCAEWLARTASGPHGTIIRPSRQSKSKGPSEYAAEEVTLDKVFNFVWSNILNGSAVHFAVWDEFGFDKFLCPRADFRIGVIVVIPFFHFEYLNKWCYI